MCLQQFAKHWVITISDSSLTGDSLSGLLQRRLKNRFWKVLLLRDLIQHQRMLEAIQHLLDISRPRAGSPVPPQTKSVFKLIPRPEEWRHEGHPRPQMAESFPCWMLVQNGNMKVYCLSAGTERLPGLNISVRLTSKCSSTPASHMEDKARFMKDNSISGYKL